MFFHLGHISLSQCTCYFVRGRALGNQGGATHVAATHVVVLYVGEGSEREQCYLLSFHGFQSLPLEPTSKLGPSCADSQVCGLVYVLGPCGSLQ